MDQKLYPGAIVRLASGAIGLVENVEIKATIQIINSRLPAAGNVIEPACPVFVMINGDVNSPELRSPHLTVIATAGDTGIDPTEL